MNPLLQHLQPYPFERLRQLFTGVTPPADLAPISLGIGEPRHATPEFIKASLNHHLTGLASYPATAGDARLRATCSAWMLQRYGIHVDASTQILPVNGSREALFSFAQTIIDPAQAGATVLCPNPFYQIYEGAALLAGAQPYFVSSDPARNFAVDWDSVPAEVWAQTQLMYVCSPGNPTGAVMPLEEWKKLFALSDRYGFVIASDECYSEIYFRDEAPLGGLEAAVKLGRDDFRNLGAVTSLSKRSNVPGLRSGFVAGDAQLIQSFLIYRTYHGGAMGLPIQHASIAAWSDESHVEHNRALYQEKFAAVMPILEPVMDVRLPDAGFYLWPRIPDALGMNETEFARELFAQSHVTVLPGSYLARNMHGHNPGAQRVRLALVAETQECVEAAQRIADFIQKNVK